MGDGVWRWRHSCNSIYVNPIQQLRGIWRFGQLDVGWYKRSTWRNWCFAVCRYRQQQLCGVQIARHGGCKRHLDAASDGRYCQSSSVYERFWDTLMGDCERWWRYGRVGVYLPEQPDNQQQLHDCHGAGCDVCWPDYGGFWIDPDGLQWLTLRCILRIKHEFNFSGYD